MTEKNTAEPDAPEKSSKQKAATTDQAKIVHHAKHKFLAGLFDLTWRLAVVLLLPILIGYWLDRGRDTPVFTLVGVVLGVIGAIFVIKKTSDEYSNEVEFDD